MHVCNPAAKPHLALGFECADYHILIPASYGLPTSVLQQVILDLSRLVSLLFL